MIVVTRCAENVIQDRYICEQEWYIPTSCSSRSCLDASVEAKSSLLFATISLRSATDCSATASFNDKLLISLFDAVFVACKGNQMLIQRGDRKQW